MAIEDRCSHDDGPLAEGEFDAAACTVECPRHGSLFDLRTGRPKTLPAYQPVRDFEVRVEGRRSQTGSLRTSMATPETAVSEKQLTNGRGRPEGHRHRLRREVRLPRSRDRLRLQGAQGPAPGARRDHLRVQGGARVDARVPAQGARALPRPPDPDLGRQPRPRSTSTTSTTSCAPPRRPERELGRGPRGHQEHLRPARHPRGRAQVPLRRRRPVRVRGRLPPGPRGPREAGRDLHATWTPRCASTRTSSASTGRR